MQPDQSHLIKDITQMAHDISFIAEIFVTLFDKKQISPDQFCKLLEIKDRFKNAE